MKEYMVQMKLGNGKWCKAHRPNKMNKRTYNTFEEAQEFMNSCCEAWNTYIEKCKNYGCRLVSDHVPVKWRIVSREVTEWVVSEEGDQQ